MNNNFTEYMMSFYGDVPHAIYDYKFTKEQIELGTALYKTRLSVNYPDQEFEGDSVDRERVRDIIINTCYKELA